MAKDSVTKAIVELLRATKGAYGIYTGRGTKHPFVSWSMKGQRFRFYCPSSPSDKRTRENCLAEIRRILRNGQQRRTTPERRKPWKKDNFSKQGAMS